MMGTSTLSEIENTYVPRFQTFEPFEDTIHLRCIGGMRNFSGGDASAQTGRNNSGRLRFRPLAILSIFTSETFLTPRSMPL
jgi:hypothetical protein